MSSSQLPSPNSSTTALGLALIGVYGALAYLVASRTRELGLRVALGSQRAQIFAMVVRRGMTIIGIGVVAGIAGALATTRLIQAWLYHTAATDVGVFATAAVSLLIAGLFACVIPARRAMAADPMAALRADVG